MRGLNKIIGGLLGFLIAGPKGCLLGVLVGHIFDRHLVSQEQSSMWKDFFSRITHNTYNYQEAHITPLSQSEVNKAYEILQISKDATAPEVQKAYRKAISRHHPDRLVNQGETTRELKVQQIKEAYKLISKTKNFS